MEELNEKCGFYPVRSAASSEVTKPAVIIEFVHSIMMMALVVELLVMHFLLDVHWHGHFHLLDNGYLLDDVHGNMDGFVDDSCLAGRITRARHHTDDHQQRS